MNICYLTGFVCYGKNNNVQRSISLLMSFFTIPPRPTTPSAQRILYPKKVLFMLQGVFGFLLATTVLHTLIVSVRYLVAFSKRGHRKVVSWKVPRLGTDWYPERYALRYWIWVQLVLGHVGGTVLKRQEEGTTSFIRSTHNTHLFYKRSVSGTCCRYSWMCVLWCKIARYRRG